MKNGVKSKVKFVKPETGLKYISSYLCSHLGPPRPGNCWRRRCWLPHSSRGWACLFRCQNRFHRWKTVSPADPLAADSAKASPQPCWNLIRSWSHWNWCCPCDRSVRKGRCAAGGHSTNRTDDRQWMRGAGVDAARARDDWSFVV